MQYEKDVTNRIKRIQGQVKGLEKMMNEEKDCHDVVTQMSAIRSAIDRTAALVVSQNLEQCIRNESNSDQTSEEMIKDAVNLLVKSR